MNASYVRRHGKGKRPLNSVDSFPMPPPWENSWREIGDSYFFGRDLNQTAEIVFNRICVRIGSVILVQVILDVAAIIGFCSILEPLWSIKEFLVSLQSLQLCVRRSMYSTRDALYWSKDYVMRHLCMRNSLEPRFSAWVDFFGTISDERPELGAIWGVHAHSTISDERSELGAIWGVHAHSTLIMSRVHSPTIW